MGRGGWANAGVPRDPRQARLGRQGRLAAAMQQQLPVLGKAGELSGKRQALACSTASRRSTVALTPPWPDAALSTAKHCAAACCALLPASASAQQWQGQLGGQRLGGPAGRQLCLGWLPCAQGCAAGRAPEAVSCCGPSLPATPGTRPTCARSSQLGQQRVR